MTMRFEDPAADFVPAVQRVFGAEPRVLDGSRAVLVGDVKLTLEAGERELWLVRVLPPALEDWIDDGRGRGRHRGRRARGEGEARRCL